MHTPSTRPRPPVVTAWHEIVRTLDPDRIPALLADDVVFGSPAVHAPQKGRALTTAYLTAALEVIGPRLSYHRELWDEESAMLEFTTEVGGREVHGIDLIRWNADQRIVEFTVMVRPLQGLNAVVEHMGEALSRRS